MSIEQDRCECCGQVKPLSSPVQVDLTENTLTYDGQTIRLTSRLASIAYVLARRMPETVSFAMIAKGVWGNAEPDGSTEENIRVAACQLRPFLASIGIGIFNTRLIGYRMDVASAVSRSEAIFHARRRAQKGEHNAQA